MLHFFVFYAVFYLFTRFRFAYPKSVESNDENNETVLWFAIWPIALELITIAWLIFEFYDKITNEKTSSEE